MKCFGMDSHKLIVKLFVERPAAWTLDESVFVPVFHSFIQTHALSDHLLIDVADYTHVPDGPGTMLVAHEANLSMDHSVGSFGLMYQRKQPIPGADAFGDRLAAVFGHALRAAARLEEEPSLAGRLKFRTQEVAFRINDRLHAPNTRETYEQVAPALREFFAELYRGSEVAIEQAKTSPLQLFQVNIKASRPPAIADLLQRLPLPATAPSR
jgi:hypothetical protein